MRAKDWSATPLGAAERWPEALKVALRILLTSRFDMWLGWGARRRLLLQRRLPADAGPETSRLPGQAHPRALGRNLGRHRASHPRRLRPWRSLVGPCPAAAAGAARLSRGDVSHVLLQPRPRRWRGGARAFLRRHGRHDPGSSASAGSVRCDCWRKASPRLIRAPRSCGPPRRRSRPIRRTCRSAWPICSPRTARPSGPSRQDFPPATPWRRSTCRPTEPASGPCVRATRWSVCRASQTCRADLGTARPPRRPSCR